LRAVVKAVRLAGVVTVLVVALALALLLQLLWRVRYGHPPASLPRVLCFHKLSRRFLFEGTWTTPERFAAYLDRLRARGYAFIDESRFLSMLDHPQADASRHIFLTFDDGYADTVETAHEILAARGIPFHVFLVSDYAGRENTWDLSLGRAAVRHLSWERVRELSARGVTFGSHGASHADLTRLSPEERRDDLVRSRRAIEAATGRPVRTLSYPFGRCHRGCEQSAREAGFEAAFSLYPARHNADVSRFALRRDAVYLIDPVTTIERKLARNAFYGLEEMKCRAINAVAVLTPLLKRPPRAPHPG
jgi:peptidoglycan/xylan/chitin deacetylase (PgdA/CDA1 family)